LLKLLTKQSLKMNIHTCIQQFLNVSEFMMMGDSESSE
jgi:hypothetical protein